MRGSVAWVIVLLLTAGLSGCIGATETGQETTDEPLETAEGTDAGQPDAPAGEVPVIEQAVDVEWQGTVGTWAYVCTMVDCVGQALPLPADQAHDVSSDGQPVAVDLTVTFEPPEGAAPKLGVIITQSDPCNGGECEVLAYAEGASPIQVTADGLETDPQEPLRVIVFHPFEWHEVAGYQGGVQTDFTVTGTVTHLVPQTE